MNTFKIMLLLSALCAYMAQPITAILQPQGIARSITFAQWEQACTQLPPFNTHKVNPHATPLTTQAFSNELERCCETLKNERATTPWINNTQTTHTHADQSLLSAQKLVLPQKALVAIHGDMHGDIHSLNAFINDCVRRGYLDANNPFKIAHPAFYILFLGDYVDRGWYGCEVLYTVARLKNENPNRVFMVRGNHEDLQLNDRYGFTQELNAKCNSKECIKLCARFYELLPVVLYMGTNGNYVQCCHGGIEIGFNPRLLLGSSHQRCFQAISNFARGDAVEQLSKKQFGKHKHYFTNTREVSTTNGFMWNDFLVDAHEQEQVQLSSRDGYAGRIFNFGKEPTHEILNYFSGPEYKLRSIFRAHQHSCSSMRNRMLNLDDFGHNDDKGIAKLWIGSEKHKKQPGLLQGIDVVTFWVAPNTGYKTKNHSFGLLSLTKKYKDWRLQVVTL